MMSTPQERQNFGDISNLAHAWNVVKRNEMELRKSCQGGNP